MVRSTVIPTLFFIIVAGVAGISHADTFSVTTNYEIRVTEFQSCEQMGEITISPDGVDDFFYDGQIITVELREPDTIAVSTAADYTFGNPVATTSYDLPRDATLQEIEDILGSRVSAVPEGCYRMVAVKGQDDINIYINPATPPGSTSQPIRLGHEDASRICFDFVEDLYDFRRMISVSYKDNQSNTFSGDIYLGAVKPVTTTIETCAASNTLSVPPANQVATCGVVGRLDDICLEITETYAGAFPANSTYRFAIGKREEAKAGLGFGLPAMQDGDVPPDGLIIDPTTITRYNHRGEQIDLLDFNSNVPELYANTAYMEFDVLFPPDASGPQSYFLSLPIYYSSCVATQGEWDIEISGYRPPCGSSIEKELTLAQVEHAKVSARFPYAAANSGGWVNGLAITNPSDLEIEVQFEIREADSDLYTGRLILPGHSMQVGWAEDVMSPVTEGNDTTFGDESYTVKAMSDSPFYGFLFMSNGVVALNSVPIISPGGLDVLHSSASGVTAIFPYAPSNTCNWFNGLAITNPNESEIEVQFIIREADSDLYTGSLSLPGYAMKVDLAENLMNPVSQGSDETFGDENYTITAVSDSAFYGSLVMYNGIAAHGYEPIMLPLP